MKMNVTKHIYLKQNVLLYFIAVCLSVCVRLRVCVRVHVRGCGYACMRVMGEREKK